MWSLFPLLAVVVIAYNVLVVVAGASLNDVLIGATLPSGAAWTLSLGDLLILGGIGLLFFEIFKASLASSKSGIDHAVSMGLFVITLLEFLLVAGCGTGVFLVLTTLTLVDVIAGFTVSLSTARRDISVSS